MILLFGCAQAPEAPQILLPTSTPTLETRSTTFTDTPEPPEPEIPTDTILPTATEILSTETQQPIKTQEPPTLTALPEGIIFRDDFDGQFQPGWTWINEDTDKWSFVEGGWLESIGDDKAFYIEEDFGMVNFLTRDIPDGEFVITVHVQSNPSENFQQAAIYIYEDQDNYIALNIGYCEPCKTGGPGFYMETFIDNNPFEDAYMVERSATNTDVYLRLVNKGGSVTGYYAIAPGEWQRVGAFGNYFDFKYVGLGTTNSNLEGVDQDIVSRFDYFEISKP